MTSNLTKNIRDFISFSILFLLSFGFFNLTSAEAQLIDQGNTLPGYDTLNSKMSTPNITLNYYSVDNAKNNLTISYAAPDIAPFTTVSYKVNSMVFDVPPMNPFLKSSYIGLPTDKEHGFKVGDNKIYLRFCNAEGCGAWSDPEIFKINMSVVDRVCDPNNTVHGVCGSMTKMMQHTIVDGKVYPYHYFILNDPLASNIRKPGIIPTLVPTKTLIIGGSQLERFWDWAQTDDVIDRYQIKVNDRVSESYMYASFKTDNGVSEILNYNGYKLGENKVSVRFCTYEGCGPWSDEISVNVGDSMTTNYCWIVTGAAEFKDKVIVKAKSSGTVLRADTGIFSADSDLGGIAAYLGAPIGSIVQLTLSNIQTTQGRCGYSFPSVTKNGFTTTESMNQYKVLMNVRMVVMCTGADCEYSGQDYLYNPTSKVVVTTNVNTPSQTSGVPTKPYITTIDGHSSIGGTAVVFWQGPRWDDWTHYSIKVNSVINEVGPDKAKVSSNTMIGITELNGFKVGDNTISIRACNAIGCSGWSDSVVRKINNGWSNASCSQNFPSETRTILASNYGIVYGGENDVFTTDSDLGTIATFLGAKVGKMATLEVSSNLGCPPSFKPQTRNAIKTLAWTNGVEKYKKKAMKASLIQSSVSSTNFGTNSSFSVPAKPNISGIDGSPYLGGSATIYWQGPMWDEWTHYSIKVNSVINEVGPDKAKISTNTRIEMTERNGFKYGNNDISIRACNSVGCSEWSNTVVENI